MIFMVGNIFSTDRLPKAGPTCSRIIFCLGAVKREKAPCTLVDPIFLVLSIFIVKCRLRAAFSQNFKLFRVKALLPFFLCQNEFLSIKAVFRQAISCGIILICLTKASDRNMNQK